MERVRLPGGLAYHRRLPFAFTVLFPPLPRLQQELGETQVALGLVGAAMATFERLELWDNLIVCHRMLVSVPSLGPPRGGGACSWAGAPQWA